MKRTNTNRGACCVCKKTKDNKEFVRMSPGGPKVKGGSKRTCYQCEAEMWNPIITRRLVV